MIVKDIIDVMNEENENYELRMSCMTLEYTKTYPNNTECGCLYTDCATLNFEIDWNHRIKTYANELYAYDEKQDIISWDCDDGNMIEFKDVVISDEEKLIILV